VRERDRETVKRGPGDGGEDTNDEHSRYGDDQSSIDDSINDTEFRGWRLGVQRELGLLASIDHHADRPVIVMTKGEGGEWREREGHHSEALRIDPRNNKFFSLREC
jgi:hypothetical protein